MQKFETAIKNPATKIYALLSVGLFMVALLLFFGQKPVAAIYTSSETPLTETKAKPEIRCGWFSNPTPANAWLRDKDGEWLIGEQGGFQADGDWASFKPNQWVETNGSYGYGCTCMTVTTDKKEQRILTIIKAAARPLSACRKDKKLKEPK